MSAAYLVRRLGQMILVMWIVSTIVFFLFRVIPGDQAAVLLGQGSTEEARDILRSDLGIDQPLLTQYGFWLGNLVQGDLGIAFGYGGIPVKELLSEAVVRSFELATVAFLMAVGLAVPVGVLAASREGSWIDHATRGLSVVGFSMPSFWLGILLLLMFSATLPWFPSGGYVPISEDFVGHLRRLILPVATVGVIQTGVLARFMRANMVEVRGEDYIRTARSKGLTEGRINFKHALRNSALSFLTVAGIQFGLLLGGMVVVETVFAWPGLGYLTVQALQNRAYAVVQGAVLVAAGVFVIVNTAVDLAYAMLDPRIRHD